MKDMSTDDRNEPMNYLPPAGTWVVAEGKVQLVKSVREENCITISDGSFETSGHFRGRVFPLTLRNKAYGEAIMSWCKRARYGEGRRRFNDAGLNHPDINRLFLEMHDRCLGIPEDDDDARNLVCDEARDAAMAIERAIEEMAYLNVAGVRLFSR